MMRTHSLITAVLSVVCHIGAAHADEYDAALDHQGRSAADLKRDSKDRPAQILRLAGIKPGMKVADVLAGDGYYSELLSYLVGAQGRVLLINNAAFDHWAGQSLPERLKGGRLQNVEHETLDLNHMGLGDASLDAVFLVKVYHDLYWVDPDGTWPKIDASSVLEQLVRALKPGAVLVVVDHSAKPGSGAAAASSLHRIEAKYAIEDFEKHGLQLSGRSDVLRQDADARDQSSYQGPMLGKTDRFVLIFRKPR